MSPSSDGLFYSWEKVMSQLRKYKSPSTIKFVIEDNGAYKPRLSDTKRGTTFIMDGGAICMRTDVSGYQAVKDCFSDVRDLAMKTLGDGVFVTNLQSGRTYAVAGDPEVEYVRITMTLDGEE
jgi:hypothetical protein